MTAVSARPSAARTQATGFALCAAAFAVAGSAVLASLAAFPEARDGWQHAARYTARVSFLFFVPVFYARPWHQLRASAASRWAVRNRRYLGLAFATDANLGPAFANGAFVGQHGSWNRKPVSGYKVIFVPFGETGFPVPNAKPVDVLTGFLDGEGRARGRPVGVIVDKTGALLVADDVGNRIWRVSR